MAKKRKSLPSKYKIASHWASSKKSPSWLKIDLGEPSCWCCGDHWNGKYDIDDLKGKTAKQINASFQSAWKRSPLQRCHIVPHSLGGSDDPSNLFLMCAKCHSASPDCAKPDRFFKWINQKRKKPLWWMLESVEDAKEMLGVSTEELLIALAKALSMKKDKRTKTGYRWENKEVLDKAFDKYSTHLSEYSRGSRAMVMEELFEIFSKKVL